MDFLTTAIWAKSFGTHSMHDMQIRRSINAFFAERGKGDVALDIDIFETGVINSMELLELLMHLEEALGIELPQDFMTVDNFRTVETIIDTIKRAPNLA